jgi:hypothetical protein
MPAFRIVHGGRAGPAALGILVPPGDRTVVVVRPRALNVDLVMVGPGGEGFFEASRQAAGLEAQGLSQALQGDSVRLRVVPAGEGFHVQASVGRFLLIACSRIPGQAYRPQVFAAESEAQGTAEALHQVMCPPADAGQELYTNLSGFHRSPPPRGETGR